MYPPNAPFAPAAGRTSADVNLENTIHEWNRRTQANIANPGLPQVNVAPGWDAFWGAADRNAQDAAAEGKSYRLGAFGGEPMASPSAALARRGDPGYTPQGMIDTNRELADDTTNYQLGRQALARSITATGDANEIARERALDFANRTDLSESEDQKAREKAALDAAAGSNIAINRFATEEPLRRAQLRENVQGAGAMAPFNPGLVRPQIEQGIQAGHDIAKENAAGIAGQAAVTRGAETAYGRVGAAAGLTPADVGGPTAAQTVRGAMDSLAQRAGLTAPARDPNKIFPADQLEAFGREHGLTPDQAKQYISEVQGYTIR